MQLLQVDEKTIINLKQILAVFRSDNQTIIIYNLLDGTILYRHIFNGNDAANLWEYIKSHAKTCDNL